MHILDFSAKNECVTAMYHNEKDDVEVAEESVLYDRLWHISIAQVKSDISRPSSFVGNVRDFLFNFFKTTLTSKKGYVVDAIAISGKKSKLRREHSIQIGV